MVGRQPLHVGPRCGVRERFGESVAGLHCFGHSEVLVGDGAVGDPCVGHRHPHRPVAEERGDGFEAHTPVDRLGGQGVPELVGMDVADARSLGCRCDIAMNGPAVEGLAVIADHESA